jgi:hypothetical protein
MNFFKVPKNLHKSEDSLSPNFKIRYIYNCQAKFGGFMRDESCRYVADIPECRLQKDRVLCSGRL